MKQELSQACEELFSQPYKKPIRHLLYNGAIEPGLLSYVESRRLCAVLPSTRRAAILLKQYVQQRVDDNHQSFKWGF